MQLAIPKPRRQTVGIRIVSLVLVGSKIEVAEIRVGKIEVAEIKVAEIKVVKMIEKIEKIESRIEQTDNRHELSLRVLDELILSIFVTDL